MHREVRTGDELRTIVGHPTEFVVNNVTDRLAPVDKEWLAHSPLGFVATTDAQGRVGPRRHAPSSAASPTAASTWSRSTTWATASAPR
jgi:predicted pyridoxine 5'-phosphate oxidase superfamily flavin-nucleotide-binding protein